MPRASIVIRSKNEERWIRHCLRAVAAQRFRDYEIILVDNQSTDSTRDLAAEFGVEIVALEHYRPGAALNRGIERATGEFIICLSGHCVPVDDRWLGELIAGFEDPVIAGVYGRQMPMSFTSPHDKRDLLITFGLDSRVQIKDSFFHNANSAIRRERWDEVSFDEEVSNIEDRIWAKAMLERGQHLLYQPSAAVYHHHGIHHGGNDDRTRGTIDVLERLEKSGKLDPPGEMDSGDLDILGLIPFEANPLDAAAERLLHVAIQVLKSCPDVDRTVVLTESSQAAHIAIAAGAEVPVRRRLEHGSSEMDLGKLYNVYLESLEESGIHSDLIVSVEPTYALRPDWLLPEMIEQLVRGGYDSVVPVMREYNYAWRMSEKGQSRVDAGDLPRPIKDPLLISVKGLGLVTRPEFVRQGRLLGDRVGLVEVPREWIHRENRRGHGNWPDLRQSQTPRVSAGTKKSGLRPLSALGPAPI